MHHKLKQSKIIKNRPAHWKKSHYISSGDKRDLPLRESEKVAEIANEVIKRMQQREKAKKKQEKQKKRKEKEKKRAEKRRKKRKRQNQSEEKQEEINQMEQKLQSKELLINDCITSDEKCFETEAKYQAMFRSTFEQEGRNKWTCHPCEQSFRHNSHLRNHFRLHHLLVQFECTICGLQSRYKPHVRDHIKTEHMKIMRAQCYGCHKKYPRRSNCIDHIKRTACKQLKALKKNNGLLTIDSDEFIQAIALE